MLCRRIGGGGCFAARFKDRVLGYAERELSKRGVKRTIEDAAMRAISQAAGATTGSMRSAYGTSLSPRAGLRRAATAPCRDTKRSGGRLNVGASERSGSHEGPNKDAGAAESSEATVLQETQWWRC
jgi:hypothetical protein